eukprot:scaffold18999_cov18-Phaeocystis_antarctica.AAC.2
MESKSLDATAVTPGNAGRPLTPAGASSRFSGTTTTTTTTTTTSSSSTTTLLGNTPATPPPSPPWGGTLTPSASGPTPSNERMSRE